MPRTDNSKTTAEALARQLLDLPAVQAVHFIDLRKDTYDPGLAFRLVAIVNDELAQEYLRCYLSPRALPVESLPDMLWQLLGISEKMFFAKVRKALGTSFDLKFDIDFGIVLFEKDWPIRLEQLCSQERVVPGYEIVSRPFNISEWRNITYCVFDPSKQRFGRRRKV